MTKSKRLPNRRRQILAAATRLFSDNGYDGTSIRLIVGSCDITEAALYRHFKSKSDLYTEVILDKARQHDIRKDLATRAGRGGIEEILTMVATHILALADRDSELMRLMHYNVLESGPGAAVLFRDVRLPYIEFLTEELTRRMAAGEVRDIDPFISSRCFVGMVMDCALSAGVWSNLDGTEFVAEDVVCNNVPIFARGLLDEATQAWTRPNAGVPDE